MDDDNYTTVDNLLTLRDQFALAALTGLLAYPNIRNQTDIIYHNPRDYAVRAYVYADAMLNARQKGPQP